MPPSLHPSPLGRVLLLLPWLVAAEACGSADHRQRAAAVASVDDNDAPAAVPAGGDACVLGPQDGNGLGGPSMCCGGNFALCDGFEGIAPGQSPNASYWEVERLSSTYGRAAPTLAQAGNVDAAAIVEVSNDRAARGTQSLHIRAQNSNQLPNNGWHHDMVVNRSIFPAPNNTFWGRAFVYYVSDANSAVPNGHATYADASGTVSGSKRFCTWWRISTFGSLAINCEHGDQSANSPNKLPTNRWACLEWQVRGDANNSIALYLDGNQIAATTAKTSLTDNPNGRAPAYDAFRLGWEVYGYQYNPTPKLFDMYYDEVVLDYNRIGCSR